LFFFAILSSRGVQGGAGYYLLIDLVVGPDGAVAFYGETNKLPVNLDPRLGSVAARNGRFGDTTDQLTSKEGLDWRLRLAITEDYSDVFVNVYLPPGASVRAVGPSNWTILSDRKRLVVNFASSFKSADELDVRYALNGAAVRGYWSHALLAIAAAGCFAAVLGARRFWPRANARPSDLAADRGEVNALLPTLNERERMVLDAIVREGGRIPQSKLKYVCGLPKSTLSRVTNDLQRKGLIRKIPVGQTNELRLSEALMSSR